MKRTFVIDVKPIATIGFEGANINISVEMSPEEFIESMKSGAKSGSEFIGLLKSMAESLPQTIMSAVEKDNAARTKREAEQHQRYIELANIKLRNDKDFAQFKHDLELKRQQPK